MTRIDVEIRNILVAETNNDSIIARQLSCRQVISSMGRCNP
jgi:hypothetical protein